MKILALGILFGLLGGSIAYAVSPALYLSPASGDVSVGETFPVNVMVDTQGKNANAVAAYLEYPANLLAVRSLATATSGSPMQFIVERNYGGGRVEISGGTPTPGFNGVYNVGTIEFQAIAPGDATLSFTSDSAVLLDSDNTNILQSVSWRTQATVHIANANIGTAPSVQAETPQYRSPLETMLAFFKGLF